MKNRLRVTSILFAIMAILAFGRSPAAAAPPQDLAGRWEGTLDLLGTKLAVDIDFVEKGRRRLDGRHHHSRPGRQGPAARRASRSRARTSPSPSPASPATRPSRGRSAPTGRRSRASSPRAAARSRSSSTRGEDPVAKVRKALEGFDELVAKGLAQLKVPGAAVAVVKDKEVILAKGFGFRDVEGKLPMTADTLLAIGSSTKAFTAFTLGTLVDQGQVEWDKPVRTYIPWFRLYDAQAGERLTPRDLVTHRSGLPRHDLVWYNNTTATRERLVRSLAYLPPTADLREKWQYNNLMFLTAGYLVETMTGKSWEESVRALVFAPLGMTRSNFSVVESQKDKDFALPYDEREGKITKIPFRDITLVGPAGSINSSVNEMSRWVSVHINGGKLGDTQVIGAATLADLHTPYMTTGAVSTRPDITAPDYALGWIVDTYRGHRRVHHGGNIDGFSAMVSFLPNDGLGFVVLTNKNGTGLPELLVRTAADRILGLEAVDWIGDAAKQTGRGRGDRQEGRGEEGDAPAARDVAGPQARGIRGRLRPSRLRRPQGDARRGPARLRL